jgi:hypothetical protein
MPNNPKERSAPGSEADSSANPPGWPGMDGRSKEHESTEEGETRKGSDVTESQRELERKAPDASEVP